MDTVIATPHVAGVTAATSRSRAAALAESFDRVARNPELANLLRLSQVFMWRVSAVRLGG